MRTLPLHTGTCETCRVLKNPKGTELTRFTTIVDIDDVRGSDDGRQSVGGRSLSRAYLNARRFNALLGSTRLVGVLVDKEGRPLELGA